MGQSPKSKEVVIVFTGDATGLKKAVDQIDKELGQLVVQTDRAQAALGPGLGKATRQIATNMNKTATATKRASGAMNQFSAAQNAAMKQAGRNRANIQNLGFQIQDIAVQAEMGTNSLRILGQQGSQILGILGPGGAIAGGILAVGAAITASLVPALFKSNKELTDLEGKATSAFNAVETAVDAATEAQERYTAAIVLNGEGRLAVTGQVLQALAREARALEALAEVEAVRAAAQKRMLESSIELLEGQLDAAIELAQASIIDDPNDQYAGGRADEARLAAVQRVLKENEDIVLKLKEQNAELNLVEALMAQTGSEAVAIVDALANANTEAERYKIIMESLMASTGGAGDEAAAQLMIVTQQIADNNAEVLEDIDAWDKALGPLLTDTTAIRDAMEMMAGFNISDVFSDAASAAGMLRIQANGVLATLMSIAQLNPENQLRTATAGGPDAARATARTLNDNGALNEFKKRLADFNSPDPAGGGGSSSSDRDPLEEYEKALELQRKQLTMTEAQSAVYSKLGDEVDRYTTAQIDGAIDATQAYEDQKQQLADIQSLYDTAGQTMADGLLAMVEGTSSVKDAFKDMARDILRQLYQIYVVQQLIGVAGVGGVGSGGKGLMGILSGTYANGGVFDQGNVVPFAKGGVVSGPTVFPMSSGMGLMGEAGAEAVMPLSRGSDGKLGVAGPAITINNYSGQEVQVDRTEEMITIAVGRSRQAVQNDFAASMTSGQGTYARSMEGGYNARRKAV